MRRALSQPFAMVAMTMLIGCAIKTQPRGPLVTTMSGKLPTLAALPETRELQEKGGIQVSVGPVPYTLVRSSVHFDRDIPPSFTDRLVAPQGWQYMRYVERRTSSVLKVHPDSLRFRIVINNHLPRVFRAAGTVVQFNIGGKLVQVDQAGYADLVNLIVPPRAQHQTEVYGPPIGSLPDQTTVGLFLYDVATKTDAAGNITEKQNFEWYFNYAVQLREEPAEVSIDRLWLRL